MMLREQDQRPLWQANYKSMSAPQLIAELQRLAKYPHHYDNHIVRKAYIAGELMLRPPMVPVPIIVMEDE
jgi:hypothetical protein